FSGEYHGEYCSIFAYRDGKLETVFGVKQPLRSFEIENLVVADGQVYVGTERGLITGTNDTQTTIVSIGDAVPGGKLRKIQSLSAAKGHIAFAAEVDTGGNRPHQAVFAV